MKRREVLAAIGAASTLMPIAAIAKQAETGTRAAPVDVSPRTAALYERSIVFNANLYPPVQETFPFPQAMLDMVRNSGITAVKASLGGINASFEDAIAEISLWQKTFETYPDIYIQVRTATDIERAKREKKMGVLLSFETATPLADKIDRIALFRGLGVKVMQLDYNLRTPFGTGVLGDPKEGLSTLGQKAVEAMNREGVAIDISHSNALTSNGVLKASNRPVLITHCGCYAVYSHPRNKPDDLLRAVADKGGVVGIYDLPYLTASPKQPTLDDYLAHMTHALNVCGEDHVGIGSDSGLEPMDTSDAGMKAFNEMEQERRKAGVAAPGEDRMPYVIGLNNTHRAETIADALLKRGYKARTVEKIIGLNFTRALAQIWGA